MPIEGSFGMRFVSWEWLELSAVTIPANVDASIATIKSIDAQQLAKALRPRRVHVEPLQPELAALIREYSAAGWDAEAAASMAREDFDRDRAKRAPDLDQRLGELEKRFGKLVRYVGKPSANSSGSIGTDLGNAIKGVLPNLIDAQLAERNVMTYCGVWREGETYYGGEAVTDKSALWICQRKTQQRPGEGDSGWQLAVKSPR